MKFLLRPDFRKNRGVRWLFYIRTAHLRKILTEKEGKMGVGNEEYS